MSSDPNPGNAPGGHQKSEPAPSNGPGAHSSDPAQAKAVPSSPDQGQEPNQQSAGQPSSSKPSPAQERAKKLDAAGRTLSATSSEAEEAVLDEARRDFQVGGGSDPSGPSTTVNFQTFVGQDDTEFRAYKLTPDELDLPFVACEGTSSLASTVRDRRFVIVRGPAGIGKAAALINALGEVLPDGSPVWRLEPGTDLRSLSFETFTEPTTILLPDLASADAAHLDDYTVNRLASQLEHSQGRLCVTVGEGVALHSSSRTAVVELAEGPTPREVFDKHFARLLVAAPVERRALLADPQVRELLESQLGAGTTMERAGRVAQALADAKGDIASAAAVVGARLDRNQLEDCARWFRGLPNLRAHCMAIALAVLNGLPREFVSSAADRLEELIAPKPDLSVASVPVNNPFASTADVQLSVLLARSAPGTRSTYAGDLPSTVLRYVLPQYPLWVLGLVWREHDAARPAIVTWLEELGRHEDRSVRLRTSTAVGRLTLEAFDFVYPRIILKWALDDDPDYRDSAALALGPPAVDVRLQGPVRLLVQEWAQDENQPYLQATAARTLGESGGLARPSAALRQLATLAEIDNIDVAVAVAKSLGELVTKGTPALAGRVLTEVEQWARQTGRELRLVGRLAFLQLTHMRLTPEALRESYGNDGSLPTLLLLAQYNPSVRRQLAGLWADGLNSADVHTFLGGSLDSWADAVERKPEFRALFVGVMAHSSADPRTASILARAAERWSSHQGSAPNTAQALMQKLTGVTAHA